MDKLTLEQEQLVAKHMYMSKTLARKYKNSRVDYEDLVQEGYVGLVKAARKYDPAFGTKFSTYAHFWVRQAIIESLTNKSRTIRLPSHVVNYKLKIYKFVDKFILLNGHEPEPVYIAESLDIKEHIVKMILGLNTENMANFETEDQVAYGTIVDDVLLDEVIEDERLTIVINYINELSVKDRIVLGLKFGIINRLKDK